MSSALIQDAVIRNLEVIGEAANNIRATNADFTSQHAQVPWDDIYGMRNRIAHGYFDINLEVVWQTVQNDLPVLHRELKLIVDSIK